MTAIMMTRDVGKTRQNAELAANLWANKAIRVQVETSGIQIGKDDAPLNVEPRVPGYWIAGAMKDFRARMWDFDFRGVWFSDIVGSEPGFALIDRRGHVAIDSTTRTASHVFHSVLVCGIMTFTVRYPASVEQHVRAFLKVVSDGWIRLGGRKSVHGAMSLLKMEDITVDEARQWETYAAKPQSIPEPRYQEVARQLVEIYQLQGLDPRELKDALAIVVTERSPFGAALLILNLIVRERKHGRDIWNRQLRKLPERLPLDQKQLDLLFGRELAARLRVLSDMLAVREYLDEILKVARASK